MERVKLRPLAPKNWPGALKNTRSYLKSPLNIHNIIAHHPGLMNAWMPFRNQVVADSCLSPRQRELIILRTAHNCQADYEWKHHVERGLQAGLDETEIERVKQGPGAVGWRQRWVCT
jgi:alkylhydroperoxidase family enzyme